MIYEAYYASELSDCHPMKVNYGFVQAGNDEDYKLTLVVFNPTIAGTALSNLNVSLKAGLVKFLIDKHIYEVPVKFINVAFIWPSTESIFGGLRWEIDVLQEYAEEIYAAEVETYSFWKFWRRNPKDLVVRKNTRELTNGLTKLIRLENCKTIGDAEAKSLLEALKVKDYGDFNLIIKKSETIAKSG
ncbi:hypothetical protein [Acinetobacter baumannii]|uniref:Uncharacterized protein n=1 Tax=Acinetobacter baumannii TaxID=470 RepID=A0A5N5XVW6_ACIBA|nr:hypothetical protein [Acinetobacter baumannii]KAB8126797.1 hypothetical protein FDO31_17720 [Acinetobacter baumannii]MQR19907.1 hypothetical protein [Acinetobacter baumannii]MQR51184.1 hypothetical protein [Acinetobacter baumannii]